MEDDTTDDDTRLVTTRRTALAASGAAVGALGLGSTGVGASRQGDEDAADDDAEGGSGRRYRVTVANLTSGQFLTPPAVAVHDPSVGVFSVGDEANEATREVAENGNLDPLAELIEGTDEIRAAAIGAEPLVPSADPGSTGLPYTVELELSVPGERGAPEGTPAGRSNFLTFVAMLIATNDGFAGLDTVPLPTAVNESRSYLAASYDAGTERNTERFADIVPPAQALAGIDADADGIASPQPELDEGGVVSPHPGLSGDGDLDPDRFGWDDPVALVHVERTG
ncbi:hypothetical protein BRC97_08935 [Halobacteriales archaeon QS_6_71_20]|nr:MAG: hypothetical protein BRC97_08935 [Halobacteriales archaeon QS_6_71_20]